MHNSKLNSKGQRRKPGNRDRFEVKRDSVRVRGRFSPQKAGGLWYESWIIEYSIRGRRSRERRATLREAKACAEAAANKLAQGEIQALELKGEDRRIYLTAVSNLEGRNIRLDAASREFADAKKIAKDADLREVARFFSKYARNEVKAITIPALVVEFVSALERDKRSDYHVRDMNIRLGRFAKDFSGQISEVTTAQIEEWLRGLTSLAGGARLGGPLKNRSRNNYRNAIVEMFNFARKHGYLPKDLSTEAASANRVTEDDKRDNEIFTPEQIDELLSHAKPPLVPSMAVKAFSGVRTEEVAAMEWEHISFERNCIILPKAVTKTKRRRIVPILPNLRKWIEPFNGLTGRICFGWSTPESIFRAWDRVAKKRKIQAGANRFRNSYISYRVAQTSDAQKVSLESGNSPRVILEDYLELATPEDANSWFGVMPSAKKSKDLAACASKLKRSLKVG
jgi:integrase